MAAGGPGDVAATLAELERQLRELEQELRGGSEPPASAPARELPVDDLVRFREQLVRSTQQLVTEYTRLLERLGGVTEGTGPSVTRRQAPAVSGLDATVLSGDVTIEAGPFGDAATASAFVDAVARIEGLEVVASGDAAGGRTAIDVKLARPLPLAAALRTVSPVGFQVVEAGGGRLVLATAS